MFFKKISKPTSEDKTTQSFQIFYILQILYLKKDIIKMDRKVQINNVN